MALPHRASCHEPNFSLTFDERALGLSLEQAGDRIRVARVKPSSPAWERGIPPLVFLEQINGRPVAGSVEIAQKQVQQASRPVTLTFDRGDEYSGLTAEETVEKAAQTNGLQTGRVNIRKSNFLGYNVCGFATRQSDVIEVEYTGRVQATGAIFDDTESRGRPFAAMLGNGDILRGLELGLFEMCIGEEREITVPPALGFGARGSRTYGVPPNAVLVYETKLVSINGVRDRNIRREELADEQRY